MRVLHLVKTSDGARWAAYQAQVLVRLGIEVHVAVPTITGEAIGLWRQSGATPHVLDCSLPLGSPWLLQARIKALRQLVKAIQPDLIHSHFVTTTLLLRLALGRNHAIPRIFQVPGPLHLEHALYRNADIATASSSDYWIASSRYTRQLYLAGRVSSPRVFLSYYGTPINAASVRPNGGIRERLKLTGRIIGNINYMYPPKYYLGQRQGLKRHEDVIDAFGVVCRNCPEVTGVLVGGQWGKGREYEQRLQQRAARVAGNRIIFAGKVGYENAANLWQGFDLAVHVPISENCGGVVEPLWAGVPTIASRVGGLPEVVMDGITGWLVPPCDPAKLVIAVVDALDHPSEAQRRADQGKRLVSYMFDVNRTGVEIAEIYQKVLNPSGEMPTMFDPLAFVTKL